MEQKFAIKLGSKCIYVIVFPHMTDLYQTITHELSKETQWKYTHAACLFIHPHRYRKTSAALQKYWTTFLPKCIFPNLCYFICQKSVFSCSLLQFNWLWLKPKIPLCRKNPIKPSDQTLPPMYAYIHKNVFLWLIENYTLWLSMFGYCYLVISIYKPEGAERFFGAAERFVNCWWGRNT